MWVCMAVPALNDCSAGQSSGKSVANEASYSYTRMAVDVSHKARRS